jgi:hypothetical protein
VISAATVASILPSHSNSGIIAGAGVAIEAVKRDFITLALALYVRSSMAGTNIIK